MYDLDESVANEENINDEALASLVKSNPYLYDKKHKDFKNVEMKRDTWKVISTCCGAISGEEAENRWNQLRNQLGRKLREAKRKPPSGSGGGVKISSWELMPAMSFLIPHIEHRRTRDSMTFSHNSRLPTPLSESSNSQSFLLSSSSLSSLDSVCEEISTQHNVERNTRSSSPLIMTSDNLDNIQVSIDTTRND